MNELDVILEDTETVLDWLLAEKLHENDYPSIAAALAKPGVPEKIDDMVFYLKERAMLEKAAAAAGYAIAWCPVDTPELVRISIRRVP